MKSTTIIFLILAFLATLSIRVYWLCQKDGLFVDEGLSVTFSSNNEYLWSKNFDFNKTYTGKEIKKISLGTGNPPKTLIHDLINLWKDSKDPVHTNLYYSLLRVFLSGEKSGNIDNIIIRAGALNLLLFSFSFFLFFFFLKYVFRSNIIPLVGCFCVFIAPSAICNTLFFREYQLQEAMLFLFLFIFYYFLDILVASKRDTNNTFFVLAYSLCCALFLLSGFFSVVFVSLLMIFLFLNKQYKIFFNSEKINFILYTITFIAILYPRYLFVIGSSLFYYIKSGLYGENIPFIAPGNDFFTSAYSSILIILRMMSNQFFSIIIYSTVLINVVYLILSKSKFVFMSDPFWLFLISLISMTIIMYFAPFKTMRYIMAFFPLLILFPLVFLQTIKRRNVLYIFSFLYCFVFSINAFSSNKIDNEYHRVDDIFNNGKSQYPFANEEHIPVIIYDKYIWEYGGLVPYLNDNQTYIFIEDLKFLNKVKPNKFFLLRSQSSCQMNFDDASIEGFKIISSCYYVPRFHCNKIERTNDYNNFQ